MDSNPQFEKHCPEEDQSIDTSTVPFLLGGGGGRYIQ